MNRIGKPGLVSVARMLALSGQAAAQGKVGPRKVGPRSTAPCGQRPTGLEIPKGMENWPVVWLGPDRKPYGKDANFVKRCRGRQAPAAEDRD
ncbi:MAG TPA: hypothetical protein H9784_00050 [Candidatus Desulfovibrio intestinavium]|uniref:Uncharacterized protein n=1 Tax=Candidatus Desulfovibrio intestinavium TaxID=2838534 RepID=A0A9D2KQM3_9BACT|nr:hypothetical protein [Candidatus Desulfovibrio intestinavium]